VIIALIDGARNDDCNGGLIVTISFLKRSLADLELDFRIIGVALVASIAKRIGVWP